MSSIVLEWLKQGEKVASAQRPFRESPEVYSTRNRSQKSLMHISSSQSLPMKCYHRESPSSDSSVIPFAEPKVVVAPAQEPEWGSTLRDGKKRLKSIVPKTKEDYSWADGRRTKDFHRRPRHKMRDSSKGTVGDLGQRASIKRRVSKAPRLKKRRQGDSLINETSADDLTKDRLTLRPLHSFGIFKKGRASTPVKNGLPDLAFSEMTFLAGKSFASPVDGNTVLKRKSEYRSQRVRAENKMTSYFDSSARRLYENRYDVVTISSDSYAESRKRYRRDHEHLPGTLSPEVLLSRSVSRPSPRSAIVDTLRRKGIYSLPANLSSREPSSSPGYRKLGILKDSDKDVDDHSEYSRTGLQAHFESGLGCTADANEDGYRVTTAPSCLRSHNTEQPEQTRESCDLESQEGEKTNVDTKLKPKDWRPGTDNTTEQILDPTKPTITTRKLSVIKSRCTPEPQKPQKIPDSSSPLTALLRVCVGSPKGSVVHEKHDRMSDKKTRASTRDHVAIQKPLLYHDQRGNIQQKRAHERLGYDNAPKWFNEQQFWINSRFDVGHRERNDQRYSFNDLETLPDFYARVPEDSLYLGQHYGGPKSIEQTAHNHPNDFINKDYINDYVDCIENPILGSIYDNSMVTDIQDIDEAWERISDKCTGDDNQPEPVEDYSTCPPTNYKSIMDNFVFKSGEGDWGFEQPYAMMNQPQRIGTSNYPIEGGRKNNTCLGFSTHRMKQAHPRLKRENFWRQHRL